MIRKIMRDKIMGLLIILPNMILQQAKEAHAQSNVRMPAPIVRHVSITTHGTRLVPAPHDVRYPGHTGTPS